MKTRLWQVYDALRVEGPCTKHDIKIPGVPDKIVERKLRELHREGLAHIVEWDLSTFYSRRYPRPLWKAVPAGARRRPDAPKPERRSRA